MKRNCKILAATLTALLLCLLLAGCGGEPVEEEPTNESSRSIEMIDKEPAEPVEEEPTNESSRSIEMIDEEPAEPGDDSDISAFIGCWKYDDIPFYFVIGEEHEWMAINAYGDTIGPLKCAGADGTLELYDEDGVPFTVFTAPVNGRMLDSEGAVLSGMEYIMLLPTPEDELSETIAFPGSFSNISVNYPITMNAKEHANLDAGLSFNAEMEDGTDDYFSNITVSFQPISGYDADMAQGKARATECLRSMLDQLSKSMYGNYLIKSIGSDVKDCDTYYSITGYLWLDGSVFRDADAGTPVRATMEIRYYGPFGYVLVTNAIALENRIQNYYEIACKIADSCTIDLGWSTAPKSLPSNANTQKSRYSNGSDPGDYGTPFYWYDEDGDVWYWNGYEDEFIGFGDEYYIDDDGQYYESNDAGWDDDEWDYDWEYYEDDYDIWSDPGDYYDDGWGDYYYDDGWGDYFGDDWGY